MTYRKLTVEDENSLLFESISDDLVDKGYSVRPSALPVHLTALLLKQFTEHSSLDLKPAGIGRSQSYEVDQGIRTDTIAWITKQSEGGHAWLAWAAALQSFLNQRLFLGLFSFESHFSHYTQGDFYKKHKDAFKGEGNRVLSVVVYLNRNWLSDDGGELIIYPEASSDVTRADKITVTPSFGTIVVFLSEDFPHEVLTSNNDRYAIAGWFSVNTSIDNRVDPPS